MTRAQLLRNFKAYMNTSEWHHKRALRHLENHKRDRYHRYHNQSPAYIKSKAVESQNSAKVLFERAKKTREVIAGIDAGKNFAPNTRCPRHIDDNPAYRDHELCWECNHPELSEVTS